MRFKTFLSETPKISVTAARNLQALALFDGFKENLNVVIDKEIILYRSAQMSDGKRLHLNFEGEDITMRIIKVTGRTEPRNSKSSDNMMMYAASNWEGFPKRIYSTFATQSLSHATMFGYPRILIPADSVNQFGWMPEDFNESERGSKLRKNKHLLSDLFTHMRSFAGCVGDLFRAEDTKGTDFRNKVMDIAVDNGIFDELKATFYRPQLKQEKINQFVSFCDSMLKKHKELKAMSDRDPYSVMDSLYHLLEFLQEKELASVKSAVELIKPETFGAISYNSFDQTPQQENAKQKTEVWFEGDYLLIAFNHDLESTSPAMQVDILKVIRSMLN